MAIVSNKNISSKEINKTDLICKNNETALK
jgi:hypothetical protein